MKSVVPLLEVSLIWNKSSGGLLFCFLKAYALRVPAGAPFLIGIMYPLSFALPGGGEIPYS
jgi:hypothetical protein